MKNSDPKTHNMKFGGFWDRLLSIGILAFFLYLIYLAINGNLDSEVNQFAAWLKRLFS